MKQLRKSPSGKSQTIVEGSDIYAPPPWTDLLGNVDQAAGAASLTFQAVRDTAFSMYFMRREGEFA